MARAGRWHGKRGGMNWQIVLLDVVCVAGGRSVRVAGFKTAGFSPNLPEFNLPH